jgi:hypothetical protein
MGGEGDGKLRGKEWVLGWGREEGTLILNLLLCDVSVAAGGHVDSKSTHYYLRLLVHLLSQIR